MKGEVLGNFSFKGLPLRADCKKDTITSQLNRNMSDVLVKLLISAVIVYWLRKA
jgi:hypothetical protein